MSNKISQRFWHEEINIRGAKTTAWELLRETTVNFLWGFVANSMVVFMAKDIDAAVLINFILYYVLISYIVNRAKYETRLGKFIVLPVSAALGAFTGYKSAQWITLLL